MESGGKDKEPTNWEKGAGERSKRERMDILKRREECAKRRIREAQDNLNRQQAERDKRDSNDKQ